MSEDLKSIKDNEYVYQIGVFSKMNQVTIKQLRYYDEIGLFKPAYVEEQTGYRYYTNEQLPVLYKILSLREMGIGLEQIKQILSGVSEQSVLMKRKAELMQRIAKDTMSLSMVELYLSGNMASDAEPVIIKELPEVIVASTRTKIRTYDDLFSVVPPMGAEMERLGCVCAVHGYEIAGYARESYMDGIWNKSNSDDWLTEIQFPVKKRKS